MIIAMKRGAAPAELDAFISQLEKQGVKVHLSPGATQTVLGLVGDTTAIDAQALLAHHLVEKVIRVQEPYKRANRMFHPDDSRIELESPGGDLRRVGGGFLGIMAGPARWKAGTRSSKWPGR